MAIKTRRTPALRMAALASVLAAGFVAAGLRRLEAGFHWDPGSLKPRPAEPGSIHFREEHRLETLLRTVQTGSAARTQSSSTALDYRQKTEVLATESGLAAARRVSFESWRLLVDGGPVDRSLEARTLTVRGVRTPTYTLEPSLEGLSISEAATRWFEASLALPTKTLAGGGDPFSRAIFPSEPVAGDGEWNPDLASVVAATFPGATYAPELSSASARLTNLHVEQGAHFGQFEIDVRIQLRRMPDMGSWYGEVWVEGGVFRITVRGQGSLEPAKLVCAELSIESELEGTATVSTKEGPGRVTYASGRSATETEWALGSTVPVKTAAR